MNRRDEMLAERAELIAANEAATSWGAAVGARSERIKEIDRALAAMDAEEKHPFQAEPGYVAGFEDGLRAAADWHKRRATLERKVGLESSAKAEDYAANAIAAIPAPATASTKLIEPIDCAGTRGARAEALKSHASMLATAAASAGEEVTVETLAREFRRAMLDNPTDDTFNKRAEARERIADEYAKAFLSTYKITKRSAT